MPLSEASQADPRAARLLSARGPFALNERRRTWARYRLPRDRSARPALRAGRRPHPQLPRILHPALRGGDPRPGGALHGLRHPLLSQRLPGQQPDPGLERPRLSRRLAGGAPQPPLDQQFPGVHRPRLPGAVRGVVHAQHHRQAGDHQDDRMRDRRPRLRRRAGSSPSRRPGRPARSRRRDRLGAGRPRLRPAARAAPATRSTSTRRTPFPAGCCATASPTSRWRRATSSAASRRWRPRASSSTATSMSASSSTIAELLDRHDAIALVRRRREAARPADPRPRPRRRPFRHAVPAAAEPPRQRRAARQRHADPRRRQARRRHRRRRHRLRLHRHLDPPGRAVGDPARDHAAAAGQGEQGADLAGLAAEDAHLVEPGGRRRARLLGDDAEIHRRGRPRQARSTASASTTR